MYALTSARLLELIYPTTNVKPPAVSNYHKRPRLHHLDIGLVNYQLGMHKELLQLKYLDDSSRGKLVQQVVNQEIKSRQILPAKSKLFWVREKAGSTSEVDIIFPFKNMLIPIEVKAGSTGTLKSLHEFMDRCDHHFAVRIYGGKLSIDSIKTAKGKNYKLLSLPYFLSGWIEGYLNWYIK